MTLGAFSALAPIYGAIDPSLALGRIVPCTVPVVFYRGMTGVWRNTAKEHYTGPQSIGNNEKTARLATILFNLKKIFCLFFVILYFLCVFFVDFGVLVNYGGLWNDHFEAPAQINQFLPLVLCGRHLVDDDFPVSSQHLDSGRCRTVRLPSVDVDCCVPCSIAFACNENTACRTRCRCGSDSAFQSGSQ